MARGLGRQIFRVGPNEIFCLHGGMDNEGRDRHSDKPAKTPKNAFRWKVSSVERRIHAGEQIDATGLTIPVILGINAQVCDKASWLNNTKPKVRMAPSWRSIDPNRYTFSEKLQDNFSSSEGMIPWNTNKAGGMSGRD
ncbi:uncharacterized protein CIMG_05375 [Coccidioides immitis RS]|uniref:Uncharacterized protein n=1 Tax=Coccidioides immitis (strain RS) TaxID=246410 RepID=J3KFF4_COCIM|nr:uncharacterized protein CIMG_05375 [Coccidioides immitis RS]EAS34351.3 hypothetical protein CIMG_05375 [Coccidioides immitis RS]